MSNYPPGVSGNEPMIRGPLNETTEHKECEDCGWSGDVDVQVWDAHDSWECPGCGNQNDEDHEDTRDYEAEAEARREMDRDE